MAKAGAVQEKERLGNRGRRQGVCRRAERVAEREAEAEAEGARQQILRAELQRRFAEVGALVLSHVDAFAERAGIAIEAAPFAATEFELRAGAVLLRLRCEDDAMVVLSRGVSRSSEYPIDLTDPFSPTDIARRVAQEWIDLLAAVEEGPRHAR